MVSTVPRRAGLAMAGPTKGAHPSALSAPSFEWARNHYRRLHRTASSASLKPATIHLSCGPKKLRYVDRICERGVAKHPPRSTFWPTNHLSLYSSNSDLKPG